VGLFFACSITGVKSTYRKFALFVRLGGEGKAHTCVKRCYRSLTFRFVS
jgi:hypothetical protein